MVFDLDFVPDGIMSWFIVLTHHFSQDLHWREGVRLQYEGHQAHVELNPSTRQLWLHVRGPAPSNFFNILQHTINDRIIRRYFEGLTYRRRVPCICHKARGEAAPCTHYFDYDKVVERKKAGKPTIECGEKPYADVSVTELLEGIHYTTHDRLETKLDEIARRGRCQPRFIGPKPAMDGAASARDSPHVEPVHQEPIQRSTQHFRYHAG